MRNYSNKNWWYLPICDWYLFIIAESISFKNDQHLATNTQHSFHFEKLCNALFYTNLNKISENVWSTPVTVKLAFHCYRGWKICPYISKFHSSNKIKLYFNHFIDIWAQLTHDTYNQSNYLLLKIRLQSASALYPTFFLINSRMFTLLSLPLYPFHTGKNWKSTFLTYCK